jgi:hypothetical protein
MEGTQDNTLEFPFWISALLNLTESIQDTSPGFIPSQTQDPEIKNLYPRNLPPEFIRGVNASI